MRRVMIRGGMFLALLLHVAPVQAVTVYFKDGTRLEVEQITRIGDSVCLFVDIARIDTSRTAIKDITVKPAQPQPGLLLKNVEFLPSDDNTEIIATGEILNNFQYAVRDIKITVVLMDKDDRVLRKIYGHARPDILQPGETGRYELRAKKPKGFWKASVDAHAESVAQP